MVNEIGRGGSKHVHLYKDNVSRVHLIVKQKDAALQVRPVDTCGNSLRGSGKAYHLVNGRP